MSTKKKPQKIFKHMETEQHTAENQWVTEVIREEIKKFLESNESENTHTRICGTQQWLC
jgi:hypothetical protein